MTGFHPDLRDPRIKAVAVHGSPIGFALQPAFFRNQQTSLLWVHGTYDAIVDYSANGPVAFTNGPATRVLVTIFGGNHVGETLSEFLPLIEPVIGREILNQDNIACLFGSFNDVGDSAFVDQWGGASIGIEINPDTPIPCQTGAEELQTLPGENQGRIVDASWRAFFEGHFNTNRNQRIAMLDFLRYDLQETLPEEAQVLSVVRPGFFNAD